MKYLVILLLGVLLGGGAAIFFLGTPRARSAPGVPVKAPDPGGDPPATVVITFGQSFIDGVMGTTFSNLDAPKFQLGQTRNPDSEFKAVLFQGGCANMITILPEGSGVKTNVQFRNGAISAPLAFTGSRSISGSCIQFKGWAQTSIQLSFDEPKQTLYGRVNVEGLNLEGVSPLVNPFVTVFVQTAIDQRVNPLVLVNDRQLSLLVPVKASNGAVKAHVKDVRSEIVDGSLKLHVTYDFAAVKGETG
jgi:hypothetical protein